jgi:exonuclease VII large subunit
MIFAVRDRLRSEERHLGSLRERLILQTRHLLDAASTSLVTTRQLLSAYDPARRLAQGWSVVTRSDGTTVSRRGDVESGEEVLVLVSDGRFGATVTTTMGDG